MRLLGVFVSMYITLYLYMYGVYVPMPVVGL